MSSLRSRWEVREDDTPLLVLEAKGWRSAVRYTLDGIGHEVQSTWTGTQYGLTREGAEIGRAERVGRKRWSIVTPEATFHFRRRSIWKADQEWVADEGSEEPLGSIRRTGTWRGDAEAELPGMPTHLAVFTLAVVLLTWEQAAAAAATT